MKKVAKLVEFSLLVRVIVNENATDDQIIEASYPKIQDKINSRELGDNLVSVEEDEEVPFGEAPDDNEYCPVCNSNNTRKDFNFPETIRCCEKCGADYGSEEMDIIQDPRESLSPEEIKQRGYNPL